MKAKKIVKITSLVLLFIVFFIILSVGFYAFSVVNGIKLDKNALEHSNTKKVVINDIKGKNMDYFSSIKSNVSYEKISPYTIYAFVSLEDKRFYEHNGIDFKRILGASFNNLKAGYFKEGGSTITQQLAKNSLLTQEKTIERKLKEAKLALEIEKTYSKEEILTKYLNTIYFGHSLYGIGDACKRLFNKEPIDISLGESAILAGIVKNPLKNSPLNSIDNAIARRNLVLKLMLNQGYIDESQYESAINENYEIPTLDETHNKNIPYTQVVISESARLLGLSEREIITGGYIISTYFDENAQKSLDFAFYNKDLEVIGADKTYMLVNNASGGICAYISSINYSPHDFRRQSASTIKPIISYAPAFEQGLIIPDSPILDEKCEINGYSPNNYRNTYLGWTTIKESLATSSNACSIKLMNLVGNEYAFQTARNFGLTFDKKDGLASALGGTTYGHTMPELLTAYTTIANGGTKKDLSFIKAIYDDKGNCLYTHKSNEKRIISEETAYFLTDSLIGCAKSGTAKKLGVLGTQIASKTGTNGDDKGNFDAWNISFTTTHTLGVWYGSKDYKKPLNLSVSGGSYPTIGAKCVHSNMDKPKDFTIPHTIDYIEIDKYCYENNHILMLANENTPIEYKKSILANVERYYPTSNYFDDAIPSDFEAINGDGEVIITLTRNPKFSFKIENSQGNIICNIEKGSNKVEITLPKPYRTFEFYYLASYTEDGVVIKKSQPKMIINLY